MSDNRTEREIVEQCNGLARLFYSSLGYEVDEGYKFYEAAHPQEVGMWNMAMMAYEYIEGTEVDDCLTQMLDEESEAGRE